LPVQQVTKIKLVVSLISYDVRQKQVEVLRKLVPSANVFGHLVTSQSLRAASDVADVEAAARTLRWPVKTFNAASAGDRGPGARKSHMGPSGPVIGLSRGPLTMVLRSRRLRLLLFAAVAFFPRKPRCGQGAVTRRKQTAKGEKP
jgi:hypothetical protein